jgi:hypothetical protein
MGRSRGEDLRSDLFSFAAGHYVLFYREQPGGTVGLSGGSHLKKFDKSI